MRYFQTLLFFMLSFVCCGQDHRNMVLIPKGFFQMGSNDSIGDPDEHPRHWIELDAFWMDETEVTNAQFSEFVKATGYITTAEQKPDWDELKKQLPIGTLKPHDSLLQAGSLVFEYMKEDSENQDFYDWWHWTKGANWKHPFGPNSDLKGKENHPAVHISWDDAVTYAKWAGKRLPTEAEWEWAARGGLQDPIYPWGNEKANTGKPKANFFQGDFPYQNLKSDQFEFTAPSKSFSPNGYGLYDMAGNVWEWCSDWYDANYYSKCKKQETNPKGSQVSFDPDEPFIKKRVLRGGSFLCHDSYCSGYRVSRRMKSSPDSGFNHTGFRCAKDK